MIAKTKNMLSQMVADFKIHQKIKKIYYALVLWKLSRHQGTIKKNLLRIEWAKNQNKVRVSDDGKEAITHYRLIKEYTLDTGTEVLTISEVEIQIETGRMHQIRVHMSHIWSPILGDNAYWDKVLNSFFERNYSLSRQALHAWKIEFFHYGQKKNKMLTARIPKDLQDFISKL